MLEQTDPPSIPVKDLFPSGDFPEGEIQQYKDGLVSLTSVGYMNHSLFAFMKYTNEIGATFQARSDALTLFVN